MNNIWFISDQHFQHKNILKFTNYSGEPVRPEFTDVDHMDEIMINNHNSVVKPEDKVYFLGDVSFGNVTKFENIMRRLNGKKRLILGNHDMFDIQIYARHFGKIGSWRSFGEFSKPFVCCHYPLHSDSFSERKGKPGWCVHGHIHRNTVKQSGSQVPDKRYINVCVEMRNYTPVHIDDLLKEMV